jgi:GTPase Era involved in 16S rRNA processing
MKALLTCLLILALSAAQEDHLAYLQLTEIDAKTTENLVDSFARRQGEILRKVFSHYIEEQINQWRRSNFPASTIREKVIDLVLGRNQDLHLNLKKFVEEKLFTKLGKLA